MMQGLHHQHSIKRKDHHCLSHSTPGCCRLQKLSAPVYPGPAFLSANHTLTLVEKKKKVTLKAYSIFSADAFLINF